MASSSTWTISNDTLLGRQPQVRRFCPASNRDRLADGIAQKISKVIAGFSSRRVEDKTRLEGGAMNLVVGATGMVGAEICRLLTSAGEPIRAMVSFRDVAQFAAASVNNPLAQKATVELGGPQGISPSNVIKIFERHLTRDQLDFGRSLARKERVTPISCVRAQAPSQAPLGPSCLPSPRRAGLT
jgi:hypothetical protein